MNNRLDHILLPVNFTEDNQSTIDMVHDIVSETPARVTLLHIIESISLEDDSEVQSFVNQLCENANLLGWVPRAIRYWT